MLKTLVIILVFVGAIFVLVSEQPEKVFARTADGAIEVEGLSRNVRLIEIDQSKEFTPILENRVGLYYLITPVPAGISFETKVRAKILEQWKQAESDLTEFMIYKFNVAETQWEKVPTVVDLSDGTLEAVIDLSDTIWIAVGLIDN